MNFPTNSFYGTLLVGKANNGYISQRLMHYDHGGQYNRVYEIDTKTFSSWSFLSGIMTIGANPGNWNAITETGVYQITEIGTGGPSGAYGYGTLLHFESNAYSHYSAQIYIPHNNDPYVRSLITRSTNSWSSWRKLSSTNVNQVWKNKKIPTKEILVGIELFIFIQQLQNPLHQQSIQWFQFQLQQC